MRHYVTHADDRRGAWHFGCNLQRQRYLVTARARVGLAVFVPFLLLSAIFTPGVVTSSQSPVLPATATTTATDQMTVTAPGFDILAPEVQPDEDASSDLYGNDVTPAVAKYSFDATGSLYELHSPQTELPRLRSPKS